MNDCLGGFATEADAIAAVDAATFSESGQILDAQASRVKWLSREIAVFGYEWLSSDWHPIGESPRDLYAAISEHRLARTFEMKKANAPQKGY